MRLAAALTLGAFLAPAALAADRPARDVAQVYCLSCHGSAAMGAPRAGDPNAWQAFSSKHGALAPDDIAHVRKVPMHAGTASVTDNEMKAAVQYLMRPQKPAAQSTTSASTVPAKATP